MKPKADKWIIWRWKKDKGAYTESYIQEVRGTMIAINDMSIWTRHPTWIDIKEIKIAFVGNKKE